MKKFLSILLISAIVLWTLPVFAQASFPTKSKKVETDTADLYSGPAMVWGISIYADAASSFMGVYDCSTIGATTDANNKDEIGEATQYDTATRWYPDGMEFKTGVTVIIATGVGYIYTR